MLENLNICLTVPNGSNWNLILSSSVIHNLTKLSWFTHWSSWHWSVRYFFLDLCEGTEAQKFFLFFEFVCMFNVFPFLFSLMLWWFFIGFYSFIFFFLKLVISCWYLLFFNKLIVELFLGRIALCFVFRFAGLSDLNLSLFCWVCSCRGLLCFLFQLYFCWRLVLVHSLGVFLSRFFISCSDFVVINMTFLIADFGLYLN